MNKINREQWGAYPPKKPYSKNIDIKGLAVHYSAMAAPQNELEEIKQLQNIQKFHQVDRGWNDIAEQSNKRKLGCSRSSRKSLVCGRPVRAVTSQSISRTSSPA